jgi:hypothetical protein
MPYRVVDFAIRVESAPTAPSFGAEEKSIVREIFKFAAWKNILDRSKDATCRRQGAGLADHQEIMGLDSMMATSAGFNLTET